MSCVRLDKRWHQAVVVEQHASGIGTELLFDNGETDLIDLSTVRWRPRMVPAVRWLNICDIEDSSELQDAARSMAGFPVIKEPKTFNSIKHLPPAEQAKGRG